jgi:dTDP-4-dehydrorhamnose reductase
MSSILVTGRNGQLGSELQSLAYLYPNDIFFFTSESELDICNHEIVEEFIIRNNIKTVINCAAYTAVDKAEDQFQLANNVNNLAVQNLARIAKEYKVKLVHISTDYVFDGMNYKPYLEIDKPNPQSIYGATKLAGEQAINDINPINSIIIRTSWVYSVFGNNFVKTMLRLGKELDELNVVSDQIGTPTNAYDLAKVILTILPEINNERVELYHYSNEGVCSWYDFSKVIFDTKKLNIKVNAIDSKQYNTPAKRPFYSVLNKNKIKDTYKLAIPYWKDSLSNTLEKLI